MSGDPALRVEPFGFTWAPLVPELLVTELHRSLDFWCRLCGFTIAYDRPEGGFAYLHRGGSQVMLEEWTQPGRRWMNFQVEVNDLSPLLSAMDREKWPLYAGLEEKWYRAGNLEAGMMQFLVQDPDGYLLRFQKLLGVRRPRG